MPDQKLLDELSQLNAHIQTKLDKVVDKQSLNDNAFDLSELVDQAEQAATQLKNQE